MGFIQHMLSSLSSGNQKPSKEFELIGNCFGFFGLDGGVGTSTLAFEVANLAASQNIHTCLIDCSPNSSFAFSKATSFIQNKEDIPCIAKRFVKRTCPISDTLIPINETFKILSFGNIPLEDTFNMSYDVILETYKEAKDVFDLVVMDIQNIPWCESTIAALQCCSTVYTLCAPTPETIIKKAKIDSLMSIAGMDSNFKNIIFGKVPANISVVSALGSLVNGRVIGEYPYVPKMPNENLSNLSVLTALRGNELKTYSNFIDFILTEIIEGISDKK